MAESDIRAERLRKLQLLRESGRDAYPASSTRTTTAADFLDTFEELESSGKSVTLAGRIMSLRGQGGILFADLFDGSGRVQAVLQADTAEDADLFTNTVDGGDFVEVAGTAFKTKRGQPSVQVIRWRMLSKSLLPIPDEWYGLKDEEKKLRERDISILLDADLRAMVERRSRFWQAIRDFYLARGFLEVETPVLEASPGGADARPFVTHHHALDMDVYLRISAGELWQKRLLVAGLPKVFEIGRIFRNEGQSREHLQDYTQLESYEAYSDATAGMKFVQDLYRHIVKDVYGKYAFDIGAHSVDFAEEWPVLDFSSVIKKQFGIDPLSCSEEAAVQAVRDAQIPYGESLNKARAVDHLWKSIRKTISGPAFLTRVPVYLEPLAKRNSDNPETVDRIQVIIAGSEVGKGYSELNDPEDQRARFEEQQRMRDEGDEEAQRFDSEYLRAMEYGMPPAFGFGFSERLFAFLENKPIHETQIFPLLRPRV